jgi:hypothetical protein
MTFLAPALLVLGAAVAVPLVLHLLHRHRAPRVSFPAIRYLRRAEREHATRIRLRQLLLLTLRVAAVLLLAGAAARPFLERDTGAHPPTAVVIVLDNSLSSGAVVEDRRVLDDLKAAGRLTLDAAGPDDTFWLLRAGAPWEPAVRGTATDVRPALDATEPTDGGADLVTALERARGILDGAGPTTREIHLLSDLQATGLGRGRVGVGGAAPDAGAPIRVFVPAGPPPANRAVTGVQVGGGIPPRAGERSTVTASVAGATDSVAVRLAVDGTVRAVARAPAGAAVVLPFPAGPAGRVTGYVAIERDALAADDQRWFVAEVTRPPAVATTVPLPFLDEALTVLADAGRLRRLPVGAAGDPDVVVAPAASGADAVPAGAGVLILPPASPLQRSATNRRLADADIPWRLETLTGGEARLDTAGLDLGVLDDVRLRQVYRLTPVGTGRDTVLIRLRTGEPWAVGRLDGERRWLLLATPLTPAAGTVPTSAAMLPLLDRALTWLNRGHQPGSYRPGDRVTVPGGVVIGPGGADTVPTHAAYRVTEAGIYRVQADDREVAAFAVNPPAAESELTRASPDELSAGRPGDVRAAGLDAWPDVIYHRRLGRELTVALLVVALSVLMLESAVAATGRA